MLKQLGCNEIFLNQVEWKKRLDFKQIVPVSWLFLLKAVTASHIPRVQRTAELPGCLVVFLWLPG